MNDPLSPPSLKAAACDAAVLIAFRSVPQKRGLPCGEDPALGDEPKAEALSSAAISCWSSCMRAWSSAERLAPVLVFEMSDQKAPISLPSVSIARPQISRVTDTGDAGDTRERVAARRSHRTMRCSRVADALPRSLGSGSCQGPVFSKTQVTVSPGCESYVAVWSARSPRPVLPPLPVTVQLNGVFGSVEPPIPVSTHPIGTISFTE